MKVKVARRHCREGKGKKDKFWEKLFGKKLKKDGKKGGGRAYDDGYNGGLLDKKMSSREGTAKKYRT